MDSALYQAMVKWLVEQRAITGVTLFGSSAATDKNRSNDEWSDFDFHVITKAPDDLETVDWAHAVPGCGFLFRAVKRATGGVKKITVIFERGQTDIVAVPHHQFYVARLGMLMGLHRRNARLDVALNEVCTCLRGGYRILKGEERWGPFYARIAAEMPGVRLSDEECVGLAEVALTDVIWVRQKIQRGEFRAAQQVLWAALGETNLRLLRELRLRHGDPVPSFGLARHAEKLFTPEQQRWVDVGAEGGPQALEKATARAHDGLIALMTQLVPAWKAPQLPNVTRSD